jgi:hypothetical protein
MFRQHDDNFLPNNASLVRQSASFCCVKAFKPHLCVIHVVNFVKDDKLHVSNEICTLVEHATKDLCGHDETVCLGVDLHVAGEDAN